MSRKNKITVLVTCVICIISIVLYWYIKTYSPKYKWNENYINTSEQPYGLKLCYELLSQSSGNKKFITINKNFKEVLAKEDSSALYFFAGDKFICDSVNSLALLDFVHRGNNAFISNIHAEHHLYSFLTDGKYPCLYYNTWHDKYIDIKFDSVPENTFIFNHKTGMNLTKYQWVGYDSVFVADTLSLFGFQKVSSFIYGYVDCFRIKYGKGWFIIHHNPILFSNYYLSQVVGLKYINHLLTPYKKSKILWDEFSKTSDYGSNGNQKFKTPLRFILSEKSLRWTWYLIIIFVLLFVIFNSKRKQAYIPLLPENKNMTTEFINSVAILHYQNKSADYLADEVLKQFLTFVKNKYDISPNLKKNEIAKLLAPLSGISEEKLNELFKYYMGVKYSQSIENKDLIEFYRLTEYFYQNCK